MRQHFKAWLHRATVWICMEIMAPPPHCPPRPVQWYRPSHLFSSGETLIEAECEDGNGPRRTAAATCVGLVMSPSSDLLMWGASGAANMSRGRRVGVAEVQSWWEVPAVAHFCSLFRTAFNLPDFEIEVKTRRARSPCAPMPSVAKTTSCLCQLFLLDERVLCNRLCRLTSLAVFFELVVRCRVTAAILLGKRLTR